MGVMDEITNSSYKKKKRKTIAESIADGTFETTLDDLYEIEDKKTYTVTDAIAPVKNTASTKKSDSWFQSGAFGDGYQLGDILKTAGSTVADIGKGVGKGAFRLGEGIGDAISYGISGVAKATGSHELAEYWKKKAQNDVTEKVFEADNSFNEMVNTNSLIGEKGDNITEGLGYVGGMIATGGAGKAIGLGAKGVTALTSGLTFTSSTGSGMSEAYKGGATDKEAATYGIISGLAEAGTELIFGGLGKTIKATGLSHGLSSADDMLAKKVSSVFQNQIAKNITEVGIKSGAEGLEEVASGIIQAIGQKVTYMDEKELSQLIEDQDLLEQFITGAVVSGIAQTPSAVKSTKAGQDYITVENEQNKKTTNDIRKEVQQELTEDTNAQNFTETIQNVSENEQNALKNEKTSQNIAENVQKTPKQEAEKIIKQIVQEQKLQEQETNQAKRQEIQARINELETKLEPLQKQIETENTAKNQDKIASLESLKAQYDNPLVQEAIDNQITRLKQETQEMIEPRPASQEVVEQEASQNLQSITDEDIAPTKQDTDIKSKQLEVIQKNNPMTDDYHTGIRSVADIKTFDETINDDESFVWGDFSQEDAKKALEKGTVTVYSSKPIEQGAFVSTSQNQARDYAGNGKIYSQEVNLNDVAWINGDEGQYAKVDTQTETTQEFDAPIQSDIGITEDTTDITARIKDTLGLDKKATTELYDKVSKANSVEETRDILEDYKDINETVQDDEVKAIRDYIRTTKKDVSQFKNSITDYGKEFYKKYGRKLNIGNNGTPIDVFYQELSSQYPQYFDSNVTNVADQLEVIKDFMDNNQSEYAQKVGEISNEDLNKLAEEYYAEVHANEFNKFTDSQGAYKDIDNVVDQDALKEDLSNEVREQVKDIKSELKSLKTQLKEIQAPIKEVVQELKATKIEAPVQEAVSNIPTQQEIDNLLDIQKNKSGSEYASAFYDLKKKYGDANLYKALNEENSKAKKGTTAPVETVPKATELATEQETAQNPFELTEEQNAKIQELRNDTEKWTEIYKERYDDKKFAQKRIKGVAMQNAAEIRNVTQGDWLIPIEGGLTETELTNKINRLRSNYVGKQVSVNGKEGTITGNSFGKIGVEFTDGTNQYVDKSLIQPLEDIDSIIQEQQRLYNQHNIAPETQSDTIEPLKTEVEQITPTTEKVAQNPISDVSDNTKQRSWVKTSTESEVVKDKVFIEDLENTTYEVKSNKKTLDKANEKLGQNGYEKSLDYFNSKLMDQKVSVEDIVLGERLIQEALNKGDKKTAAELIENVAILGTELGQKIQALSIIQKLTPEGQLRVLEKIVKRGKTKEDKAFTNVQITQEMKDQILSVRSPDGTYDQLVLNEVVEQVKQKIADQMETTLGEKANAWRYLAMLGNPKTHIRNLVSNVAMKGTTAVKDIMARTIEDATSLVAPTKIKERTKTWKMSSKDVTEYADRMTLEVKDILTSENSYSEDSSIKSKRRTFENEILEKIYKFNSDMLTKEDWWFKKSAFKNSFAEFLTANGIKTKDDIKNNYKIVEKAKLYAMEQAQIATFSQMSYLANKINEIENKSIAGKVIIGSAMPFKKTPINIAKAGLSYSPLGFAKALVDIPKVKKGEMQASQLIDNISQATTGSALALVGYMLAQAGFLNGGGEDDKEGKYDSQLGDMVYSIKIGDTSYSLSWLSPVAMPLFVGANAFELLTEKEEWNADVVINTLAQTLDPLSEMSFLSGLTDVLSSYETGSMQQIKGMAESIGQNYVGQFIPTLSSQVAATIDDTKRTTTETNASGSKFINTTVNKLKYKIPLLRETLEPSIDIWGNEVKQADTIGERAIDNLIAPYSKKKDITTQVDTELKSIYRETGENSVLPSSTSSYLDYKNEKYNMTNKEYTDFKKKYGQTAYEMLEELFTTDTYATSDSTEKAKLISKVYEYARDVSKKDYFDKHQVEYTNTTEDNIPVYKEKPIKNAIEYDMSPDEYSYYEENPSKYNTIKAITDYETYKTISKDLYDIKGDKDNNDKTISGSRKLKVYDYINNLDLGYEQKLILAKMEYPSEDRYNYEIIDYLNNNNNIDYDTMESILLELGFKVDDYGNISW